MHRLSRRSALAMLTGVPLAAMPLGHAGAQAQRPTVVTTFSILGDITANIGGELIQLTTLVGPGGDTHTYEPSPSDIAALGDGSIVVEIGLGFEPWLADIYKSAGSAAQRLAVTTGLSLLTANGAPLQPGDDPETADPHVWQDVKNVIQIVGRLRDTLAATDPANAEQYRANAETYLASLTELEAFAQAEAAKLPAERRKIVTSHDSLGYLATAYGFEIVGTALGSLSTEAADPSAGEISRLVEEIRATGVPAIFTETVESADLMQGIADEAGVTLAPPLYTDALSDADGPAPTYVELVRYNMTTIVTALGATSV